jgi:hypothetical protein
MAKKATTKKIAPQKAAGKSKSVSKEKSIKIFKPTAPSETDKKIIGAYLHGRTAGAESEKLEQKIRESQMQAGPKITARVSFELNEANDCKINVSGDFNIILQKMHEIQNQSITIDKGEFFAVAAKMMKGEQK